VQSISQEGRDHKSDLWLVDEWGACEEIAATLLWIGISVAGIDVFILKTGGSVLFPY
jgi:hypothetical protein